MSKGDLLPDLPKIFSGLGVKKGEKLPGHRQRRANDPTTTTHSSVNRKHPVVQGRAEHGRANPLPQDPKRPGQTHRAEDSTTTKGPPGVHKSG